MGDWGAEGTAVALSAEEETDCVGVAAIAATATASTAGEEIGPSWCDALRGMIVGESHGVVTAAMTTLKQPVI